MTASKFIAKILFAYAGLTLPLIAASAPNFPAGAEAREATIKAKLSANAQAWLKQEATKEVKSHTVSQSTATQAASAGASSGSLQNVPIEDLAFIVLMNAARSADDDLRDQINAAKQINDQKKKQRENAGKQSDGKPSRSNTPKVELPRQVRTPPRNSRLSDYLASQQLPADSLSELGEEQQLKLQQTMEAKEKAEQAISDMMKKFSETQSSIISNMK